MSRYKIAKMTGLLYLISWGVVLTAMGIYGLAVEGASGPTMTMINQYVGPIGSAIAVAVFCVSASSMVYEANRGKCP